MEDPPLIEDVATELMLRDGESAAALARDAAAASASEMAVLSMGLSIALGSFPSSSLWITETSTSSTPTHLRSLRGLLDLRALLLSPGAVFLP